jgi:ParB family chromosome partitioning protein
MTTTITTVPFSKLVAGTGVNARTSGGKDGIDALAASIRAKGVIQPLIVRPADKDRYEVIAGNRRLAAIARLVKDKVHAKSWPVPVVVRNEDDAEALDTSLAENDCRLPMHAVDRFEAFARLAEKGLSEPEIAARYGLAERQVKQSLALGRLAAPIREAWRKGKIDAKTAQAFCLHADHAVQTAAYDKLAKEKHYGGIQDWRVRQELSVKRERLDQSDELALVGLDAYLAAGGSITEDLFEDARYVDDVPLANKLARERLEAECARLKAEGWAWAAIDEDLPDRWPDHWTGWGSIKGEDHDPWDEDDTADRYSPAERAGSGCVVQIGHYDDGTAAIEVIHGLVRPAADGQTSTEDDADAAGRVSATSARNPPSGVNIAEATFCADCGEDLAPGDDAAELADGSIVCIHCAPAHGDDTGEDLPDVGTMVGGASGSDDGATAISNALMETITTAQTLAAATALARDPALALRVAVAALRSTPWSSPAKISLTPFTADLRRPGNRPDGEFEDEMLRLAGEDTAALLDRLAVHVAASLTLRASSARSPREDALALVCSLPAAPYLAAAREQFLADDYFKRATKAIALAAIDEMREAGCGAGLAPEDVLAAMKKADLAAAAAEAARACGWLPPELRHPDYRLTAPDAAPQRLTGKEAAAEQTGEASRSTRSVR